MRVLVAITLGVCSSPCRVALAGAHVPPNPRLSPLSSTAKEATRIPMNRYLKVICTDEAIRIRTNSSLHQTMGKARAIAPRPLSSIAAGRIWRVV